MRGKRPLSPPTDRQPTMARILKQPEPRPKAVQYANSARAASVTGKKLLVVDLCCGLGGVSEGARQAGHKVVLAVDCNEELLRIHERNHPKCTHLKLELGEATEQQLVARIRAVVPEGRRWLLHCSPPCQAISSCRNATGSRDSMHAMRLVVWYLRLVMRLKPTLWTMEEVACPQIHGILYMAQTLYPKRVAYLAKVDMSRYGVPQSRQRCIAGSPCLVHHLSTHPSLLAPAPVLSEALALPPGATLIKNPTGRCPDFTQTKKHADGTYSNATATNGYQSVHKLSFTCLAGNPLVWCRADFTTLRMLTLQEHSRLQTFPEFYRFGGSTVSKEGVGNAVPPLFARKLFLGCGAAVKKTA